MPDPGPATPHLRVMTYNIHHGAGNEACEAREAGSTPDCGLNLERIAGIIRDANADIVGLQEVDRYWRRSGGTDQPRMLAGQLGMFVCFGANLRLPAEGGTRMPREYGTLLLSRYPLRGCENTPLPRVAEANELRGMLAAEVLTPGGPLRVLVTHLSLVAEDRVVQMEALAKAAASREVPTVLLGDLNARPDEESLRPILARLADGWTLAAKNPAAAGDGHTYPCHPQEAPARRIDYLLLSPGLRLASVEVLTSPTARMASDHCPVLARIATSAPPVPVR